MNYYPFHIGDYAGATRHLSWDEDMAYRRLLDAYYMREGPLPADHKQCYRLAIAATAGQRAAVDSVLAEFFALNGGGYCNARCDDTLQTVADKREKAQQSALKRWKDGSHSDGNAVDMQQPPPQHSERNAKAMRTHSDGNAPKTKANKDGEVGSARASLADLETRLREAAGWQSEPAPMLAVTGPIQSLIDAGALLETDVLPVVTAIAPQAQSRTSWKYFVKAIARSRDDRIAAATTVNPSPGGSHERTRKPKPRSTLESLRDCLPGADGGGDPGAGLPEAGHGIYPPDHP